MTKKSYADDIKIHDFVAKCEWDYIYVTTIERNDNFIEQNRGQALLNYNKNIGIWIFIVAAYGNPSRGRGGGLYYITLLHFCFTW